MSSRYALDKLGRLDAMTDGRRVATLTRRITAGGPGGGTSASLLTVYEEGGGVSVTNVVGIEFPADKVTDLGGGHAHVDVSGDGLSYVSEETGTPITGVIGIEFSDDTVTNLGGGVVHVNLRRVLSMAEPGDLPRVYPVTEIRVPDGTLTDLGDGNVQLDVVAAARTVTAGAGMTGGGALSANITLDVVAADTSLTINANDMQVRLATNSGLQVSSGLQLGTPGTVTTTSTNAVTTTTHTHAIDSTIAPSARTLTAGAGLTGGGDLSANRTFDVGAGTGITVNPNDVALTTPGALSVVSGNSSAGATAAVPTIVSGTAVSTSGVASSLNVTIDGSAAAGHKLLLVVATRGNTVTVTTPAGWELQETVAQTNVTMWVYSRIARTGDASSTVRLEFSGSINAAAVVVRSPDAIAGEFINIDGSNTNSSSTTVTVNSIATTINNCLVLTVSTWGSGASMTVDGSTTELVEKVSTDGTNNVGLNVAYYTQATAGATGAKTHTLSSGAGQAVGQFAIIPVSSGGHQHYVGATHRPGAEAILRSNSTGGLALTQLDVSAKMTDSGAMIDLAMAEEIPSISDNAFVSFYMYKNGTGGMPTFVGASARGTRLVPTAVQASDGLAMFAARGYGATGFSAQNRGAVQMRATENWTDSNQGTDIGFFTTDNGTVTVAEVMTLSSAGDLGIGDTTPATRLELDKTQTLTAGLSDAYAASLTIDPGYTGAFTVTRHNYIDLNSVSLAASAALTDAAVFRFDANAGTHKAIDSGTTKTSPGTVSAWMKININGTIYYIPAYTSKTS